ncbi:hypothetical protein EDD36DRAFT_464817 [Exophiala viscosa]|uniref:Uncharacterized protein n=1 Tax=Exophiala viscosa TaxID=2486360 RepID=A0AAN6DWC5_9EURO|nr:hypothetical protein EDD36DRAFT_464817 [Exophiala viscosa]
MAIATNMHRRGNNVGSSDTMEERKVKSDSAPKHDDLDGLRAEYLEALEETRAAQRRYKIAASTACRAQTGTEEDASHITPTDGGSDAEGPAALLARHVELRRLREKHASLVALADGLESAKSSGAVAPFDAGVPIKSVNVVKTRSEAGKGMAILEDNLARSMQALEMAVVQAHQEAMREKAKVEEVKSRTGAIHPTAQQHVQSMLATRRVLTAWLEEGLELCQGRETHAESETVEYEDRDTVTDPMIVEEYERYLKARKRVLDAVQALSKPVHVHSGQHLDGSHELVAPTASPSMMRGDEVEANGLLNTVEKALLPTLQRQRTAQAHILFATEQIDDEMAKTINTLDRLGDESQLLQAFPILARSGRFQHAASVLGKRAYNEDETKDGISKRMEPWIKRWAKEGRRWNLFRRALPKYDY